MFPLLVRNQILMKNCCLISTFPPHRSSSKLLFFDSSTVDSLLTLLFSGPPLQVVKMGIFQRVVTGNMKRKRRGEKRRKNALQLIPVKRMRKKLMARVSRKRNIGPRAALKTATIVGTKKMAIVTRNLVNIIRVIDRGVAVLRGLLNKHEINMYKFLLTFLSS